MLTPAMRVGALHVTPNKTVEPVQRLGPVPQQRISIRVVGGPRSSPAIGPGTVPAIGPGTVPGAQAVAPLLPHVGAQLAAAGWAREKSPRPSLASEQRNRLACQNTARRSAVALDLGAQALPAVRAPVAPGDATAASRPEAGQAPGSAAPAHLPERAGGQTPLVDARAQARHQAPQPSHCRAGRRP